MPSFNPNQKQKFTPFSSGFPSGLPSPTQPTSRAPGPNRDQKTIVRIMAAAIVILLVLVTILLLKSLPASPLPVITSTSTAENRVQKGTTEAKSSPALTIAPTSTLAPSLFTLTAPVTVTTPLLLTQQPTVLPTVGPPACTTAGQTWVRPADRMVMVCIPPGIFPMGISKCDFVGCEKEVNGGSVSLPGYWIDRTEVTNAMFQEFVSQTGYITGAQQSGASEVYGLLAPVFGANWRTPQGGDSSITTKANHPVVQMNWYSADAYCKWSGGRLPGEAEWEKAARGSDGRLWPWGNALPSDKLMNAADRNVPEPQSRTDQDDGFRYTSPVGAFPNGQSPYGLMDMAGNAWEWTRSIYRDYPYRSDDGREIKNAPAKDDRMVLRGGCWFDDYGSLRSTMRFGGPPERSTDGTGFRCVYP